MVTKLPRAEFAHLAVLVEDIDSMVDFYCRVLGFHLSDRAQKRAFLTLDPDIHHQLVLATGRPDRRLAQFGI